MKSREAVELPHTFLTEPPGRDRSHPSFPSAQTCPWSGQGLTLPSRKQMEPSLTFSPLLSPGMGQTSFFGLAPSPLTDGDQPAPAPQEKGGAF